MSVYHGLEDDLPKHSICRSCANLGCGHTRCPGAGKLVVSCLRYKSVNAPKEESCPSSSGQPKS